MSSNLVSKTEIDLLLTAALHWGNPNFSYRLYIWAPNKMFGRTLTPENADEVGGVLWRENFLKAEWDQDPENAPSYTFERLPGTPTPVVVLKAIAHYSYQSEGDQPDEWVTSEPYAFLETLKNHAISHLPQWDDVPWGIENRDILATWQDLPANP